MYTDSTESCYVSPHSVSVSSNVIMYICQHQETGMGTLLLTKCFPLFEFYVFPLMPFSFPESNLLCHILIILSPSSPLIFESLFLYLMMFIVLRSADQAFCRVPFNLGLSHIFLIVRLGLWTLRKNIKEIMLLFHHFILRVHDIHRTSLVMLILITWLS